MAVGEEALAVVLRGDHITLDALLKAAGLAASGGAAKLLIAGGSVQVNDTVDTRRGRKLRAGDTVRVGAAQVHVRAPGVSPVQVPIEAPVLAQRQKKLAPPTAPETALKTEQEAPPTMPPGPEP